MSLMNKLLYFVFFFMTVATGVFAQEHPDSLSEVEVIANQKNEDKKADFTAGQAQQKLNNLRLPFYINQSLAQLLSQQSSVFIKSYGVNNMASLSIRGASAAQSIVLWNGVPILNPALGVADVSLLQAGLFDHVSLQYGSAAALYGSGNVGGALMIGQQEMSFSSELYGTASAGIGSFGRYDVLAKAKGANEKWHWNIASFYQQAKNNFDFEELPGQRQALNHARLHAGGIIAGAGYNLKGKKTNVEEHSLRLDLWYQQYSREIPAAFFESVSEKEQQDASMRSILSWNFKKKQYAFYGKFSLNNEMLHYNDSPAVLNSESNVWQYFQEIGFRRNWVSKKNTSLRNEILVFVPLQYTTIAANDTINRYQFRPAVAATYKFQYNQFTFNAALRQEWWNNRPAPVLPGAGMEYMLPSLRLLSSGRRKYLLLMSLQGNIQRTYRIPTLNELYNYPGGNDALKPEQGWNREVGYKLELISFRGDNPGLSLSQPLIHELSYFNRGIRDWIIWLGGAIWTPHNLARVHSRGVETRNNISFPLRFYAFNRKDSLDVLLSFNTTYVLSTSEESYLPADSSINRQIPYTPRYIYQGNAGLRFHRWYINYNHIYTGYRFLTVDESQYLLPYQLGNIQLSYSIVLKKIMLTISPQVQNVWNIKYQTVAQRPMPGRYFLFNVRMNF